jgi:transcriptional regulator with XRE-family HTH domain
MDERQATELGKYLRTWREAAGMNIRTLAAAVGVDIATVSRLEQGLFSHPRADVLGRIATALKIPVADVLALAGYPTTKDLPGLRPYMRAKYRDLPPDAVDEVERFIEGLTKKHRLSEPTDGEDEQ